MPTVPRDARATSNLQRQNRLPSELSSEMSIMRVGQQLTARPTGHDEIREVDRVPFSIGARSFSCWSQRLATIGIARTEQATSRHQRCGVGVSRPPGTGVPDRRRFWIPGLGETLVAIKASCGYRQVALNLGRVAFPHLNPALRTDPSRSPAQGRGLVRRGQARWLSAPGAQGRPDDHPLHEQRG
jgi:hypothetical protein